MEIVVEGLLDSHFPVLRLFLWAVQKYKKLKTCLAAAHKLIKEKRRSGDAKHYILWDGSFGLMVWKLPVLSHNLMDDSLFGDIIFLGIVL